MVAATERAAGIAAALAPPSVIVPDVMSQHHVTIIALRKSPLRRHTPRDSTRARDHACFLAALNTPPPPSSPHPRATTSSSSSRFHHHTTRSRTHSTDPSPTGRRSNPRGVKSVAEAAHRSDPELELRDPCNHLLDEAVLGDFAYFLHPLLLQSSWMAWIAVVSVKSAEARTWSSPSTEDE